MIKPLLSVLAITSIIISCKPATETATSEKLTYPVTAKSDQIDDYFGVKVSDPYRWLENDTAEDVKKWVTEENKVTFGYLEKIPFRNKIKEIRIRVFR